MGFTLAVCAEMVHPRPAGRRPRARLLHDQGFAVEIWDWTRHDLDALAADRRALHLDDRLRRRQPHRARRRSPRCSPPPSGRSPPRARSAPRTSTCTAPGSTAEGLPVAPVETVTAADVADGGRHARPGRRPRPARGRRVHASRTSTPHVDHPGTPFATAADTATLVAAVDSPHLRMNLDLYHAQIGEGNLIDLRPTHRPPGRRGAGRRRAGAVRARDRRDPLPRGRGGPGRSRATTAWSGSEAWASGDPDAAVAAFREAFTV